MKTRIEEEAEKWWYKPLNDSMNSDGAFDKDMFRYKDLGKQNGIQGFIAGAEFRQKEIKELEAQNEIMKSLMYKLYNALNCAHGYIDPYENKRTDKICMEALCEYEAFKKVGEV
jgi:hypothetical protein